MNGGNVKSGAPTVETTGINASSSLLKGFSFSELLSEDAYMSNANDSLPMSSQRRYTYSVF